VNERYFLPVSSGLLEPKHVAAIGPAIWVFLWMINRTTTESGMEGIVLNGAAIRSQAIAEDLGLRDRTVRDHLNILCDGGYLRRNGEQQSRFGNTYYVQKSKKWQRKAASSLGENPPRKPNRLGENPPRLGEISPLLGENPPSPHTPLKEEHTVTNRTDRKPEPDLDHTMVARAVLETLRLSGQDLLRNLSEVSKAELNAGADPEELLARMCAAWEEYAKTPLKWHVGAAKFFGDGLWKNKALWAWPDGGGGNGAITGNRAQERVDGTRGAFRKAAERRGVVGVDGFAGPDGPGVPPPAAHGRNGGGMAGSNRAPGGAVRGDEGADGASGFSGHAGPEILSPSERDCRSAGGAYGK